MLAKRNQLEIVVPKHEESSLKQFKYLIKKPQYNYNAKVKLINVFDLPGSHQVTSSNDDSIINF